VEGWLWPSVALPHAPLFCLLGAPVSLLVDEECGARLGKTSPFRISDEDDGHAEFRRSPFPPFAQRRYPIMALRSGAVFARGGRSVSATPDTFAVQSSKNY